MTGEAISLEVRSSELRALIDPIVVYIATGFYALAGVLSVVELRRTDPKLRLAALILVALGLVARLATLLQPGLCPVTAGGSGMLIALFLALYLLISHPIDDASRVRFMVVVGLVFLLDLSGQLLGARGTPVHPPAHERALGELHGGLVLLAYACFLIGALHSALYLILYRLMKQRRLGFWFDRLPPLQQLERKSARSTAIGLVALTTGVSVGLYSFAAFHGGFPYDNIKFVVASIVWAIFASEWVARRFLGWRGVRVIWIPVVGVGVMFVLYGVGGGHPFWSGAS